MRLRLHTLPRPLSPRDPRVLLATWFGSGLITPASGTWGSLAALPFGLALAWLIGSWGLLAAAAIMFVGGMACIRSLGAPAEDDHAWIVLDEVAGLWIALAPAALDPIMVALAFILFRVFDALKPWPISWLDRHVPGPLGIMADDVAAGLVSAVLVVLADLYL